MNRTPFQKVLKFYRSNCNVETKKFASLQVVPDYFLFRITQ